MRILHLTSHLNVGGVASHVLTLSAALRQRGHEVVVASGGGELDEEAMARGITLHHLPLLTSVEFSPQVWRAGRQLSAWLRWHPVDVLHAHTRVAQVVADRLARRLRIPYVTTWHGFFRPNFGRWLWPCTGNLTIAISEPVRQHLVRDFHVPADRTRLIPHGIDPAPFEAQVDSRLQQELRDRLHLDRTAPIIGTVARLVASKGVDQLMCSFPHVRAAVPNAQLVIVGDGAQRESLQRVAAALGIADAVHFAGTLPHTRTILSLMGVFVFLPADQEGFGLSLLEAMAGRRPIVAVRRGGGATWVLEESQVGVLAEPGDAKGLAQAIIDVLRHPEAACQAAGKAQAMVKERYGLDRMVDQVEAVYREVMSR